MINNNELSQNWEVKKLSEIADKITDGTHHTPTYTETGIPFISVKDIRDQKVYFDNCKYISADEHEELIKRCNPEEGDLLITKSGTIGRLAIVPKVDFSLFVSVALIKLQKNKRNINQKWMLYFFEFHIAFLDIKSKIKGGVVKNYHLEDLRQVEIPLPPLAEQERIIAKIEELFSEL
ncbi:MAG TPA: restriction endonuclease subunit S, partial [Pyrinomonadaceae bacterium]|nr:restriction endonuclease subunit S [Pyrinomonadaceae bacterium]